MLIYQQLVSRLPRGGNGGGGGGAVCGIMIFMQFCFVAKSSISIQCLLRFRLVFPIIYFYLKIFSFFFVWIDCAIFTASKYVVECSSEVKILEND